MDARKWLLLEQRPDPADLFDLIEYCPASHFRCPAVMRVYLAGLQHGYRLTDGFGEPTETLRVLVREIGGQLCREADLPPEEKRNFTRHKGVVDPIYRDRWFIRNISVRLRHVYSYSSFGWARRMFTLRGRCELLHKDRVTEVFAGRKMRLPRFLAVCRPYWELSAVIYEGVWSWHGSPSPQRCDAYSLVGSGGVR